MSPAGVTPPSPPPPPGPGVVPPFVAPPTDGATRRRWWGIGFAATATVLLCFSAAGGFVGLLILGGQMITDQGRAAVASYLTSIKDEKYGAAYAQLGDGTQASVDELEFAHNLARRPGITSFAVGQPAVDGQMVVPATVQYADGSADQVRYVLAQDAKTGEFEVCGEES
jgi:hypothetical protein